MAEPTGTIIQGTSDVVEMHEKKEIHDIEKTAVDSDMSVASHSGRSTSGDADPLSYLPDQFRKEIEAQATVKSRKVGFKVILRILRR